MSDTRYGARQKPPEESERHASQGNDSASVTPKDLNPEDAASRDLTERHLNSPDPDERQQELLDDAIDLSFPASDPPAIVGGVSRIERPSR
jgi:hypothetical protein